MYGFYVLLKYIATTNLQTPVDGGDIRRGNRGARSIGEWDCLSSLITQIYSREREGIEVRLSQR